MTGDERIVRNLLAAVDAGDLTGAAALLADDVRFRLGGTEPTIGPAAMAAAFGAMTETVVSLSHEILQVWAVGAPEPAIICELGANFERHDGSRLTLPCMNVYRLRGGHYRVYMDPSLLTTT
jgi:ketosteroid isomerase-like protein